MTTHDIIRILNSFKIQNGPSSGHAAEIVSFGDMRYSIGYHLVKRTWCIYVSVTAARPYLVLHSTIDDEFELQNWIINEYEP